MSDLISREEAISEVIEPSNDLISRAEAIARIANDNVVGGMDRINEYIDSTEHNDYLDGISTAIATVEDIPSADAVSREFYEDAVKANIRIVIENRELKEQIESADRPSGEWLKIDTYFEAFNETVTTYKCSVCGHEPYFGGDISKLNYCPNCGARMKGGNDV